ncbi:MAG: hypothetical protein U1E28_08030 [Beijerinckiaceae bacterium]
MRRIHLGLAGALLFAGGAASWDAFSERNCEAAAAVALHAGSARERVDLASARTLLTTEAVLRRAALRAEAAAVIERRTRPGRLDALLSLVAPASYRTDTIGRAVTFLAERVDVRAGAWPEMIEIVARMPSGDEAAAVATAAAEAFAADVNDTWLAARRRDAEQRATALDRATHRLEEAKERVQALRASDPLPVASIAPAQAAVAGRGLAGKDLERLRRDAVAAAAGLEDAARTYGPRHPQLLARQNEARRARLAFESAARAPAPEADPPATVGGPDPRAADIAAAEQRLAEAQGSFDLETSRRDVERREARVLKPAAAPARPSGGLGGATIALAGAFGFLAFFGAPSIAPALRSHASIHDRALGRLRNGVLVDGRRAIEKLDVAAEDSARRILVAAPNRKAAGEAAAALSGAAILQGWRPLLVELEARAVESGSATRVLRIDGEMFFVRRGKTAAGPIDVAVAAPQAAAAHASRDASTTYDCIVAFVATADLEKLPFECDCLVALARSVSNARATRLMRACGGNVRQFAGTLLT